MKYEIIQRIEDIGDYDPDGLADFFDEQTDMRLLWDVASGDYLLVEETRDRFEAVERAGIGSTDILPLNLDPAADEDENPFTLDSDASTSDISRRDLGAARPGRDCHGDDAESNGGDSA